MKALLLLMTLAVAMPVMAVTTVSEIAGPRVVGNGGGGVREDGVYKTFYSAGLYINPQMEMDIPGADLLSDTILSLVGNENVAAELLSIALPMGKRRFYKVLESKMDDKVMERLLAEYARIVTQPSDSLTIFAITDIGRQSTYLLPSFYKLSKIEQAAILFHEAYWILNPKANYAEVVSAEMEFQKFLELKEAGKYDLGFPKLLGKLMNDPTIPVKASYRADMLSGKAAPILHEDGSINVKDLLFGTQDCSLLDGYWKESFMKKSRLVSKVQCMLVFGNLSLVMTASKKYPESYFLKALANYLSQGNILFIGSNEQIKSENKETLINEFMNKKVNLENVESYDSGDGTWFSHLYTN